MSKSLLIDAVAEQLGGTKAEAARAIDAVAAGLSAVVGAGNRVILPPLGTFNLKDKAERQARNPRTGEPITIAARQEIHLKPAKKG